MRPAARKGSCVVGSAQSSIVSRSLAFTQVRGNASKAAAAPQARREPSASSQQEHPLFDLRRLKQRAAWKPKPPEDADYEVFPNERLGNIYQLNYSVHDYGIIPVNELYRNLHVRGLQMYSHGKIDKQYAVHITLDPKEEEYHHYFIPPPPPPAPPAPPQAKPPAPGAPAQAAPPPPPPAAPQPPPLFVAHPNAQTLDSAQYKKLSKELRREISNGPHIFMHDGAVGSSRGFDQVTRFLASDADTALALRHLIPRLPLSADPGDFGPSIVALIAPGLKLSNPAEYGLKGNNFTLVDFTANKVLIGGTRSLVALQQAVSSLASFRLAQQGVLPLSAESFLDASGKPILMLGSPLKLSRSELFGLNTHLWSPLGISKVFSGASVPYSKDMNLVRGDLVWTSKGETSLVASLSKNAVPAAGHPSKIVFVTEGTKTELNKLPNEQATERYASSFNYPVFISAALLKERFGQLLSEQKVTAFELTVNKNSKDKATEARALLLKN